VARTVDDRLVLGKREKLVVVPHAPVGDGERGRELSVVLHLLEDLPEGLELAAGDDKGVVQEEEVGLSAEPLERAKDGRPDIGDRDRLGVRRGCRDRKR
jgi:hypothetical protein